MLTATITITAPDHASLVECCDLVTHQVAAGTNAYEDQAEDELETHIRYRVAEIASSERIPVAVDYPTVEEYGISPESIDAIIEAIMHMASTGSITVAEITTQTVIGWLFSEINTHQPQGA